MIFQKHLLLIASFLAFANAFENEEPAFTMFGHRKVQEESADSFAMCDGCWCIKGAGETCREPVPPQDFSSLLPSLRRLAWDNPYSLDCDPYLAADCDTVPPLQDGGACVVKADCSASSYSVETYPGKAKEALDEGLEMTHEGACGACSSLQDLAVYMQYGPALRGKAQECGVLGVFNKTRGFECFVELGMTDACAWTWFYNTVNTRTDCGVICTEFLVSGEPPNGPAPNCTLAKCLQCDENNSGPIFKEFSGRTRRNSYLWSSIGRPCSAYGVALNHTDPCPSTETSAATSEVGISSWSLWSFLFNIAVAIWAL